MTWKAIIFDFNGVIINDEPLHQQLIDELLLGENLRPSGAEYKQLCLGRSDRSCLRDILSRRGRVVSEEYLTKLIQKKARAYRETITQLDPLPIYPDVTNFLAQIKERSLLIALVTGALRSEVELVLNRAGIAEYFSVIVAGDDITTSKPQPDGYLLAVELLERQNPSLRLKPCDCLALEDTPAGISAAKNAGIQVVGVANTYPFHMLQRQTNWTVDRLSELELDRVEQVLGVS
jgi:HAD superfamily hydrolase (TIGR01509 family)